MKKIVRGEGAGPVEEIASGGFPAVKQPLPGAPATMPMAPEGGTGVVMPFPLPPVRNWA